MAKIILTAENFAFGPISKLLFIATELKKRNHYLIFAGYGTSLQLAKKFPFNEIYEIDTDDEQNQVELKKIIDQGQILVSSMDLNSIKLANYLDIPTVWVDCLFWFWKEIPELVFDVDAYIRELTIDDSKNTIAYQDKIKNFHTVGPIIGDKKIKNKRQNKVLISYGGGEAQYWYKVGKDTNYPFVMTEVLANHIEWSNFDEVTIATNEKIIQQLKNKYPDSVFQFKHYSQTEFIQELSSVQMLLTTAGLVTTESAFNLQTPTIFLPSSNNSHHLLLTELRNLSLAPASVQLDDFMKNIKIKNVDPHQSMQAVMKQLRTFEKSPDVRKKIGDRLNQYIQSVDEWAPSSVTQAHQYLSNLGEKGTEGVVRIIEDLLKEEIKS